LKKYYIPQTIALFLLLVVLPVGSWFYLKSGLNYRKTAFAQLGNFGKFNDLHLRYLNKKAIVSDTNHVIVVGIENLDSLSLNNLHKIVKAYEQRNDFIASRLSCDTTVKFSYDKQLIPIYGDSGSCIKIRSIINQIENHVTHKINTLLINSKGIIVNGYDVNNKSSMAEMIKHVSIILPGNKKVDSASVKRSKEK
jgi:hypothetical protein